MAKRRTTSTRSEEQRQAARPKRVRQSSKRKSRGQAKKKGLKLDVWTIVLVVAYLMLAVGMGLAEAGRVSGDNYNPDLLASILFRVLIVSAIFISLPTLLVWIISKSHKWSNATCAGMACFLGIALFTPIFFPQDRKTTTTETNDATNIGSTDTPNSPTGQTNKPQPKPNPQGLDDLLADPVTIQLLARTAAGAADIDDAADRLNTLAQTADRLARGATGDDRLLAVIGPTLRDFSPLYAEYARANKVYVRRGGISPATLQQQDLITQRLAILESLSQATQAIHEFLLAHKDGLPQQLMDAGFSQADADRLAKWWMDVSHWGYALPLRYHERYMLAYHREAIEIMGKSLGYWSVDGAGVIRFTDLPEQMAHQRIVQKMDQTMSNYRPILANLDRSMRAVASGNADFSRPEPAPTPVVVIPKPDSNPSSPTVPKANPHIPTEPEIPPVAHTVQVPPTIALHDVLYDKLIIYLEKHKSQVDQHAQRGAGPQALWSYFAEDAKQMLDSGRAYVAAQIAYDQAGGIDPKSLPTRKEVQDRISAIYDVRATANAFRVTLDRKAAMQRELGRLELSDDLIAKGIDGAELGSLRIHLADLTKAEFALASIYRDVLEVLWGAQLNWGPAESGGYAFSDQNRANKLTKVTRDTAKAIAEINRLRAEVQKILDASPNPPEMDLALP